MTIITDHADVLLLIARIEDVYLRAPAAYRRYIEVYYDLLVDQLMQPTGHDAERQGEPKAKHLD